MLFRFGAAAVGLGVRPMVAIYGYVRDAGRYLNSACDVASKRLLDNSLFCGFETVLDPLFFGYLVGAGI